MTAAPQYVNLVTVQFGTEEYLLTLKCHCGKNEHGVEQVHNYGTIIVSKAHAKSLGKLLMDGPDDTATPPRDALRITQRAQEEDTEPWKPAPAR